MRNRNIKNDNNNFRKKREMMDYLKNIKNKKTNNKNTLKNNRKNFIFKYLNQDKIENSKLGNVLSDKINSFNILIRCSYRPNSFKKCIKSILEQTYQMFRIIICYDDDKCLEYLKYYSTFDCIDIFKINNKNNEKYFYNLYSNKLLKKVDDDFVLFIDDDDGFKHKDSLKYINSNIKNEETICHWKVQLGRKVIYSENLNNLIPGNIASCGICFHSKYSKESLWESNENGDFMFFKKLIEKNKNLNPVFLNEILTENKNNIVRMNGLNDIYESFKKFIENENIKQLCFFNENYENYENYFEKYDVEITNNPNKKCLFIGGYIDEHIEKVINYEEEKFIIIDENKYNMVFLEKLIKSNIKIITLNENFLNFLYDNHNIFSILIDNFPFEYKKNILVLINKNLHKNNANCFYDFDNSFKINGKNNYIYCDYNDFEIINNLCENNFINNILFTYGIVHNLSWQNKYDILFKYLRNKKNIKKSIFIQDEYYHIYKIEKMLNKIGIDNIFTVLDKDEDINKIYERLIIKPKIIKCLTGYVPSDKSKFNLKKINEKKMDIFYRGRKLHPLFGELGILKFNIGYFFKNISKKYNLISDISLDHNDRIYGNEWYKKLSESKITLASPSGCNVLNYDYEYKYLLEKEIKEIKNYSGGLILDNKDEDVVKIYEDYFNKFNNMEKLNLEVISPKLFEAVLSGTVLVMYECKYNNIFLPNIHYIPLKKDHSNIEEVVKKIKDDKLLQKIANKAYKDIILSNKYNYKSIVELFEKET